MNKFLFSAVTAAALLSVAVPVVHATTVDSTFGVAVSLIAICTATNSGLQTLSFGDYTAFGSASIPAPTTELTFECTRGLTAPTFTFDAPAYGLSDGTGVLAGLNYSLTAANGTTTNGGAATPGVAGTADVRRVTISGVMPAGQAGLCANTASGCSAQVSHNRTLTVTY